MIENTWLADIPREWEIAPFGSLFTQRKEKNKLLERTFVLSVMKNRGVIPYTEKGNVGNKVSEDLSGYKLVNKGDFVLNSMNLYMGSVGVSDYDGVTSTAYIVCKPSEEVHASYYKYLIQCRGFQEFVGLLGKGIMEIREAVRWMALKSVHIPTPPIEKQKEIANYLDVEVSNINQLIKKKNKLINAIEEKRSHIINTIVREGISEAEMKTPNLFWLNKFPKHWKLKRLRHIGTLQNGISQGADYFGSGYPFIGYGDVYKNPLLPKSFDGLAMSSVADQKRFSVKRGDVFFTRTSETAEEIGISSVCAETIEKATFSGFLIRFRPNKDILIPEYARYYFRSNISKLFFVKEMNLVTRVSLGQNLLKNLPVLLPPLEEQRTLAAYLDKVTSNIDSIIQKENISITKLKDFKSSLITEADRRLDKIEEEMAS